MVSAFLLSLLSVAPALLTALAQPLNPAIAHGVDTTTSLHQSHVDLRRDDFGSPTFLVPREDGQGCNCSACQQASPATGCPEGCQCGKHHGGQGNERHHGHRAGRKDHDNEGSPNRSHPPGCGCQERQATVVPATMYRRDEGHAQKQGGHHHHKHHHGHQDKKGHKNHQHHHQHDHSGDHQQGQHGGKKHS